MCVCVCVCTVAPLRRMSLSGSEHQACYHRHHCDLTLRVLTLPVGRDNDWDYLSARFWVGIWTAGFLLIMVVFNLSALVRYITRFTEESFACLIALIFIVEAFKKLADIGKDDPMRLHVSKDEVERTAMRIFNNNSNNESICKAQNLVHKDYFKRIYKRARARTRTRTHTHTHTHTHIHTRMHTHTHTHTHTRTHTHTHTHACTHGQPHTRAFWLCKA